MPKLTQSLSLVPCTRDEAIIRLISAYIARGVDEPTFSARIKLTDFVKPSRR